MKEFTITTELINKVLEYLGNRPYNETSGLIAAIQGEYAAEETRSKSMFADKPKKVGGFVGDLGRSSEVNSDIVVKPPKRKNIE